MIFLYGEFFAIICITIPIILTLCSIYAYQVNAKRAPDDPEKKNFHPAAPWLAPIVLPPLLLANIVILIVSSLMFSIFLVLFPFALLLFRKPFLIIWIQKQALKVGNWILKINTGVLQVIGFQPTTTFLLKDQKLSS